MTDEQINAAIAEACGWTECRLVAKVVLSVLRDPVAYGIPPNGTYEFACLNYCTDLNAMHEAEKVLTGLNRHAYCDALLDAVPDSPDHLWEVLTATARQRAETFLLTLGKWSATDKESLTVGATTEKSSAVQSTSSGVSGGASTYGGKGLGIAGATWPPETRITVNGKTFCLADIDKEMTE
jgi:hypothetical protein